MIKCVIVYVYQIVMTMAEDVSLISGASNSACEVVLHYSDSD